VGHTARCSDASTWDCECECGGLFHGMFAPVGSAVVVASQWITHVQEASEPPRQVYGYSGFLALQEATDESPGSVAAWLVKNPGICDGLGRLAGPDLYRVVYGLPEGDRRKLGKADHRLCRLLEEMAIALDRVARDLPEATAKAAANAAFPWRKYPGPKGKAMRAALKAIVQRVFDLTGLQQLAVAVRALRVAAVMTCLDLDGHRSLLTSCVKPLADETVEDEAKEEVRDALRRAAGQQLDRFR
jgi:hypothetical protein